MKIKKALTIAVAAFATCGLMSAATSANAASPRQAGYDATVCNTGTAYIYKQESTSSERLDALPSGAHFQVYSTDGGWDFGVRNYNGISGHVLAGQLCATGQQAQTPAAGASTARPAASQDALTPGQAAADSRQPAQAVPGTYKCVNAASLYLRNYPAGQAFNQLYRNETFSVYEFRDSGWARGYAFGGVNSDQSGYAAPYNDIWVESAYLSAPGTC